MHALGFYHEQARPDAKDYIKVQERDSIFLRKIKRFLERRPRSVSFDCLSVLINYVISGLGLNLGFELTVVIIALKSIKMLEHCVVAQVKSPVELNLIRCHCTNGNLRDVVESMISAL